MASHLMKDSNRFMTYAEFKECHDVKVNYPSFYGLLSALKALKATFKYILRDTTTIYEDPVNRFLRCKKTSKLDRIRETCGLQAGLSNQESGEVVNRLRFGNRLFCGLEGSLRIS